MKSPAGESDGQVVVIDGSIDVPQRYPRALGRQPLKSVNDVREEMARVYRAVAAGKISTKQGTQMVYMLSVMTRTIEIEQIEGKLDAMIRERELRRMR